MPKHRSLKGIPENLRPLAKKGLRVRFNGFWLNDSEQDRAIAQWLDETPNAASVIKFILYQSISGRAASVPMIEQTRDFEPDETANALLNFED